MRFHRTRMSFRAKVVAAVAAISFFATPQLVSAQYVNEINRTRDTDSRAEFDAHYPVVPASAESCCPPMISQPACDSAATQCDGSCNSGCSSCGCCCDEGCWKPCGWYLSVGTGWTVRETVHEIGNPATFLEWNDGFSLNGAVGYDFKALRAEFEVGFTNNGVDTAGAGIPNVGNFVSSADGNVSLRKYMFNAYYDFDFNDSKIKPYVGAGVGFFQSEINSLFPEFFNGLNLGASGVNTTSNLPFAYQLKAGVNYELSQRTELYLGYCFFHGESLDFAAAPFGRFHPDGAVTHSAELGLRFKL